MEIIMAYKMEIITVYKMLEDRINGIIIGHKEKIGGAKIEDLEQDYRSLNDNAVGIIMIGRMTGKIGVREKIKNIVKIVDIIVEVEVEVAPDAVLKDIAKIGV